MITGVNHITLAVRDPETSLRFYRDVLQFKPVATWPNGSYLLAGDLWIALVRDAHAREESLPEYTHVAFTVAASTFAEAVRRILDSGARVWKDNESEGPSLYFEDPNGHKLEIHAGSLETRLAECRANPWPGLELL